MKNITLAFIVIAGALIFAHPANAAFYVYSDGIFSNVQYQNGVHFAPVANYGLDEGFGLDLLPSAEAGLLPSVSVEFGARELWGSKAPVSVNQIGGTADLYVRFPIVHDVYAIATGGISFDNASFSVGNYFNPSSYTWDTDIGGGAEFALSDSLTLRAIVDLRQTGFRNFTNGAIEGKLGLEWRTNWLSL